MSSGSATGGLSSGGSALGARETQDRASEQGARAAAELWVALAQQVSSSYAAPRPEAAVPPSPWRASAGDLTPPVHGPANTAASQPPSSSERLVLRVDGGELGELEVTLDREAGALRVVIGVENEQLARSVAPDASGLRAALERAGVELSSLNIVAQRDAGTVLARQRSKPSVGTNDEHPQRPDREPDASPRRNQRRLTLIG
jgi:flagellar hook-length control protein FliK